jgi:hypothetical protein
LISWICCPESNKSDIFCLPSNQKKQNNQI